MTAVLFCMAMIIEIVYVIMSPVPKEILKSLLILIVPIHTFLLLYTLYDM